MSQVAREGEASRNIYVFGLTSFFNDTATEMAYWVLPAFLAYVCPSFLLSAIPFLLDGDRVHVAIGIATLVLLPVVFTVYCSFKRYFANAQPAIVPNPLAARAVAVAAHD